MGRAGKSSPISVRSLWHFCVLAATLLAGPAHGEQVTVSYPNLNGSFLYLFTAIDKGYYKQEGIDIELIEAGGGPATAALISGSVQFSTSASTAISAILKGARLKVLLVGDDRPDWQIWSTGAGIKSFADLKGQPIGVISRGDTGEIAVRYYLMEQHLPPDFVAFIPVGSSLGTRLAMVKSGTLPAILLHPGDVEILRGSGGLGKASRIVDLREQVRLTFNGLASSDDMIRNHSDLVARFVRATRKGMIFTRNNRQESLARYAAYMKATPEQVAGEYDLLRTLMAPQGTIAPEMQHDEIELRGAMMELAPARLPPDSSVFDFSFARAANAALAGEGWTPDP